MQFDLNYSRVVRIHASEWFSRADFAEFVKRYSADNTRRLATWHNGGDFNECSDVFVWYDGPNDFSDPLPDHIAETIAAALHAEGVEHAFLWIVNFPGP